MKTSFVPSVCSYCGTGCGVIFQVIGERVVATLPNPASPVNEGALCIKGWNLHSFLHSPTRLTTPLMRHSQSEVPAPAGWDEALAHVAGKLRETVAEYGPDSVAMLTSARITNEENYLAQKFMRTVIGSNNIDHCARL